RVNSWGTYITRHNYGAAVKLLYRHSHLRVLQVVGAQFCGQVLLQLVSRFSGRRGFAQERKLQVPIFANVERSTKLRNTEYRNFENVERTDSVRFTFRYR